MEKQVENNVEARVKAAYLVKFTKFIYWDSRAANARSSISPIIITVLGSDPVGGLLENFSQNQKSGSPIIVNRIGKDLNNLENCNLLFISKQEAARLPTIFKQLEGSNVVTVSDINNFARRGGMIGFVVDEDRVKLEINLDATNRAGLKISAKLLELSKIITKAE
ncbi:MAG: YfiR family protein [Bacteroidota bacterium]